MMCFTLLYNAIKIRVMTKKGKRKNVYNIVLLLKKNQTTNIKIYVMSRTGFTGCCMVSKYTFYTTPGSLVPYISYVHDIYFFFKIESHPI